MGVATQARSSKGTLLKRKVIGSDAVKASYTHGSSDAQLVFTAKNAGVAGNSTTIALIDPGSDGDTSVNVTGSDIVVTLGYSSSAIDADANEVIAAIYASAEASALIDVTNGSGDGSGTVTALAEENLASGSDGTHTWNTIPDVKVLGGPNRDTTFLDGTHLDSPDGFEEPVPHFKTSGEVPFTLQWIPDNTDHLALEANYDAQSLDTYRIYHPLNGGGYRRDEFNAYVKGFQNAADTGSIRVINGSLMIKGAISRDVAE